MQIHIKGQKFVSGESRPISPPLRFLPFAFPQQPKEKWTSIDYKPLESQDLFNSFHYPLQQAQECQVKKNELKRVFLARDFFAYFPKHKEACSSDITRANGMGEWRKYVGYRGEEKLYRRDRERE